MTDMMRITFLCPDNRVFKTLALLGKLGLRHVEYEAIESDPVVDEQPRSRKAPKKNARKKKYRINTREHVVAQLRRAGKRGIHRKTIQENVAKAGGAASSVDQILNSLSSQKMTKQLGEGVHAILPGKANGAAHANA